jgi:hypothetical protein
VTLTFSKLVLKILVFMCDSCQFFKGVPVLVLNCWMVHFMLFAVVLVGVMIIVDV